MSAWALEPIDLAALVVPYLSSKMSDCTVSTRVQHRNRMVYVEQIGGNRQSHVMDSQSMIVQTYAPTAGVASKDCRDAYTWLMSMRHDPILGLQVRDVESIGLPGRFDDPESQEPRFQTTVQFNLRPLPMGVTP